MAEEVLQAANNSVPWGERGRDRDAGTKGFHLGCNCVDFYGPANSGFRLGEDDARNIRFVLVALLAQVPHWGGSLCRRGR